tara:strand:+ start:300 stop:467 length:168 start_codon:yes stop_codon:yes gene_type:complete
MSLKEIFNNIFNFELDGTILPVVFTIIFGGWFVLTIINWFLEQVRGFKEAIKDDD